MTYLKKLVMHGFKSFPSKTEILFENAMNVIVGPNGSGKSNITDALCFALGRLSIKSIRAAKAANLLFSGNKEHKPAAEASVELFFDNTKRTFAIETDEIVIKRIVRRNGQSVYKINHETKTRQEIIELLAQAGIDPNGFNIVLQGEIAALVKMNPEERRKIIEEVADISIYETRKEKSLREMEKTEEKLKEVIAILKEKNNYLKNLEKEKEEAESFKKLDETIKRCKATLFDKRIKEKEKDIQTIEKEIEIQEKEIEKIKKQIQEKNAEIKDIEEKITKINKQIQQSTSNEQETLHRDISELKAELAGLRVRRENFESRISQNNDKKNILEKKTKQLEEDIANIRVSSPEIKKQQAEQKQSQDKIDKLEQERRKFYLTKSEIATLENRKNERSRFIIESAKEIELVEKNIAAYCEEIRHARSIKEALTLRQNLSKDRTDIIHKILEAENILMQFERNNAVFEKEISKEEKLKIDILKLDVCPLCQNKITQQHIEHVISESNKKIKEAEQKRDKDRETKEETQNKIAPLKQNLSDIETKMKEIEIDMMKIKNAEEKKEQIIRIVEQQEKVKTEIKEIDSKLSTLKKEFERLKDIESEYDEARLKLQEYSFPEVDSDTEVTIKQRELNRLKIDIKSILRESEESEAELKKIVEHIKEAEKTLSHNEKQEQELYEKFQKFFSEKNSLQDQQKALETMILGFQHTIRNHEDRENSLKIHRAKVDAECESIKFEFKDFENIEIYQGQPADVIKDRLEKAQLRVLQIGSVNMRALELYEKLKEQCLIVEEKVQTIIQEKEKLHKIIAEIDHKKKRTFIKTLEAINEFFSRNFSKLSRKGEVFLDLENKQDPFAGGLSIILKVAKGKYFDIASLSGGEKTLIALSLIFAIQEYKPYSFYVFDEIDAALDKNNSEKLAALIKQYMTSGQYIIVTHNDALISEASTLYGVSMQESISKIVSLKV